MNKKRIVKEIRAVCRELSSESKRRIADLVNFIQCDTVNEVFAEDLMDAKDFYFEQIEYTIERTIVNDLICTINRYVSNGGEIK